MTSEEAKRLLALYRPKIDADDPQFGDALAQAERDPELARWLEEQCAIYEALRDRLKNAPVPEDLLEKTLRHRPSVWWKQAWLRLAACLMILAGVAYFWLGRGIEAPTFGNYQRTMASVVSKYRMSLETDDLDSVRTFLANNQAPSDYVLPKAITQQRLLGCATLSWDGHPVSLICFQHQSGADLWLFVRRQSDLKGAPRSAEPVFSTVNQVNTASWHQGESLYLLATRGDPALLRESLR
jgi:hypothetical protein